MTKQPHSKSPHQNVLINLPADPHDRKGIPIGTGVLDYFPAAIAEVAKLSKVGNDQHNPGQPLHWARHKSTDQFDTIVRHLIQRGTLDTDGVRHSTKAAWRALALLQEELEHEAGFVPTPAPPTMEELFYQGADILNKAHLEDLEAEHKAEMQAEYEAAREEFEN
jgi:hypothetical protein